MMAELSQEMAVTMASFYGMLRAWIEPLII
jgi:hypothetical protein